MKKKIETAFDIKLASLVEEGRIDRHRVQRLIDAGEVYAVRRMVRYLYQQRLEWIASQPDPINQWSEENLPGWMRELFESFAWDRQAVKNRLIAIVPFFEAEGVDLNQVNQLYYETTH